MKILVSSDETGLVKEVICPKGTDTSQKEGIKPTAINKLFEEPSASIKSRVIDMTLFGEYLVTLRLNGTVCFYDSTDYTFVKEIKLSTEKPISLINYSKFDSLIVAFETGQVFIVDSTNPPKELKLPTDKSIAAFVANPFEDGVFAFGGEENDVQIVSIFDKPNSTFIKTKFSIKVVFEAENVENDFLDLRVPISIKHIRFIEAKKFITATKYGQLRMYDTEKQKDPIHDFKIGPKPIIQVALHKDNVILSDTTSLIAKYSLTKIDSNAVKINSASAGELRRPSVKLLGKFSEGTNTGATHAIYNYEDKYVCTGGLDRYLRVFDIDTRKLVAKVYLGTQISSILFISDDDESIEVEVDPKKISKKKRIINENDDEDDEEEMWNQLESKSSNSKTLKRKSRKL